MYSDLLDVLGNQNASSSGSSRRGENNKHVAVRFKAGKMNMALQENGKFWVTPDTRRGQVQLVWSLGSLKWEWMDRREKTVVDSVRVEPGGTFERIETGQNDERIYLWTTSDPKTRTMYWMQDESNDGEDDVVARVNQYLSSPTDAAPQGETTTTTTATTTTTTTTTATTSNNNNTSNQVDALSNILENLGMPPEAPPPGGTLTLADLQGAMAGLATTQPSSVAPLSEVVTPASITSLLEDEAVKNRLLAFLPENQRSMEHLEENLRSPQVQQTLRSLTQALLPDDEGTMEGYHSVVANFQLDPKDGQAAMAAGNPIQAFLDCILASTEQTEEEEKQGDAMEE